MKKTVSINIQGIVFTIDEDAFDRLQVYLKELNLRFATSHEGKEVITDIESRIAELFQEKLDENKQVITIEDVNQVIETLGEPKDFDDETEKEATEEKSKHRKSRILYRDPDNAILGGVCGGIGAYFNIDPLIVRIIFFVLFFFSAALELVLYIILWIGVPKAKTTAQKLEMRGETVNVSNIEKSIKEEYESVKENYKKFKNSKSYNESRDAFHQFGNALWAGLKIVFKVLLVIIGVAFIFGGIFILIGLINSIVFTSGFLSHSDFFSHLPTGISFITDPWNIGFFLAGLGLVILIPVLAVIYSGFKLLFRFKANDKMIVLTSLILWFIGIGMLATISFNEAKNYSSFGSETVYNEIQAPVSQTITLKATEAYNNADDEYTGNVFLFGDFTIETNERDFNSFGKPELDIIRNRDSVIELTIRKTARGRNPVNADRNAEEIMYNYKFEDSVLTFNTYFELKKDQKFRNQEIEIELSVPENQVLFFDKSIDEILDDVDKADYSPDYKLYGKHWIMKKNGLQEIHAKNN